MAVANVLVEEKRNCLLVLSLCNMHVDVANGSVTCPRIIHLYFPISVSQFNVYNYIIIPTCFGAISTFLREF